MTHRLRGHVGTPTVPDRTDPRTRTDLMSDEAFMRTPAARCLDYPCPTCNEPPNEGCCTRTGNWLSGDRSHKTREALLWSQPCPECQAKPGQFCTGREAGINHHSRDQATHAAIPGSTAPRPPAEKVSYVESSRRAQEALARIYQLAAEGRAPWQTGGTR